MLAASKDADGFFLETIWKPITRTNFHESEFFCHCGQCAWSNHVEVAQPLIYVLQEIRGRFGPVHVTSGARCIRHNEAVGGAEKSSHLMLMGDQVLDACDIFVPGASQMEVHGVFREWMADPPGNWGMESGGGGFGIYRNGTVHLDLRKARMEWVGPAGRYLSEPGARAVEKWASRQLWKDVP